MSAVTTSRGSASGATQAARSHRDSPDATVMYSKEVVEGDEPACAAAPDRADIAIATATGAANSTPTTARPRVVRCSRGVCVGARAMVLMVPPARGGEKWTAAASGPGRGAGCEAVFRMY